MRGLQKKMANTHALMIPELSKKLTSPKLLKNKASVLVEPNAKQRFKLLRLLITRFKSKRLPTQIFKEQQCPRLRSSPRAPRQSRHGSRRWPNSKHLKK